MWIASLATGCPFGQRIPLRNIPVSASGAERCILGSREFAFTPNWAVGSRDLEATKVRLPHSHLNVKTFAQRTRAFLRCRILRPLLRLLKRGVSPKRLAWSLAVALLVGVNPFLGSTTIAMLLLAWLFGLNHYATQIGIHVVAPLQWLLFIPFIHAGIILFRAHRLPMSKADILHLSHRHPLQLIHLLWQWEWHALVIWALCAAIVAPLLAQQIRRMLVLSMRRHKDLLV